MSIEISERNSLSKYGLRDQLFPCTVTVVYGPDILIFMCGKLKLPGADPGFPVGGGRQPSLEGAPTSDTGTFR